MAQRVGVLHWLCFSVHLLTGSGAGPWAVVVEMASDVMTAVDCAPPIETPFSLNAVVRLL